MPVIFNCLLFAYNENNIYEYVSTVFDRLVEIKNRTDTRKYLKWRKIN